MEGVRTFPPCFGVIWAAIWENTPDWFTSLAALSSLCNKDIWEARGSFVMTPPWWHLHPSLCRSPARTQQLHWALLYPYQTHGQTLRDFMSLASTSWTIHMGQRSRRDVIITSISRLGPFGHGAHTKLWCQGANSVLLSMAGWFRAFHIC